MARINKAKVKQLIRTSNCADEEVIRKQYIFTVLLVVCICLVTIANILMFKDMHIKDVYNGASPLLGSFIHAALSGLFLLNRRGYYYLSSHIFVILLLIPSIAASMKWGSIMPQALLMYVIVIVISGICINANFSLLVTLFISICLLVIAGMQSANLMPYEYNWRNEIYDIEDAIAAIFSLGILTTVSYLSNREISKALERAKKSEAALLIEKDMLEIKVQERTHELKEAQEQRLRELNKFAEMGKMASGLFHDLVSPLTTASLCLESINDKKYLELNDSVSRAIKATDKIKAFVDTVRKKIQGNCINNYFCIVEEINTAMTLVEYKARTLQVQLVYSRKQSTMLFGNAERFNQLIINLLSNAIDAYECMKGQNKIVEVTTNISEPNLIVCIKDNGCGISPEYLNNIFEPLFTTKPIGKGSGLGLAICKEIVEKDFKGTIEVASTVSQGTLFTIKIPLYDTRP